jgi:hypothetical protein
MSYDNCAKCWILENTMRVARKRIAKKKERAISRPTLLYAIQFLIAGTAYLAIALALLIFA